MLCGRAERHSVGAAVVGRIQTTFQQKEQRAAAVRLVVVRCTTCLDSVPAAEGDLLVRPDHSGAAAEIVSKFHASETKRNKRMCIARMELQIHTIRRSEAKLSGGVIPSLLFSALSAILQPCVCTT